MKENEKMRIALYRERIEMPVMMPEEITEHIGHNGDMVGVVASWGEARQWLSSHPIAWSKERGMGMYFLDVELFYAEEENLDEDGEWEPSGNMETANLKTMTKDEIEIAARYRYDDGDGSDVDDLRKAYLYTQEDAEAISTLIKAIEEAEYDD